MRADVNVVGAAGRRGGGRIGHGRHRRASPRGSPPVDTRGNTLGCVAGPCDREPGVRSATVAGRCQYQTSSRTGLLRATRVFVSEGHHPCPCTVTRTWHHQDTAPSFTLRQRVRFRWSRVVVASRTRGSL